MSPKSSEVSVAAKPKRKRKKFVLPDYTFGVEIECMGGSNSRSAVRRALADAGFVVHPSEYSAYDSQTWIVGTDGSLAGTNGMEIKSPILRGADGLKTIRRVTKVLNSLGVTVNRSCGLHVHVGITNAAQKFKNEEVYTILRRYNDHKEQIDLLLARSRRADANEFCGPIDDVVGRLELEISDRQWRNAQIDPDDLAGEGDHYDCVSLEALGKYGTIEFRQHHGTTNGTKITNWIIFLLNHVEMARKLVADRQPKEHRVDSMVRMARIMPKKKKADHLYAGLPSHVKRHFVTQAKRLAEAAVR